MTVAYEVSTPVYAGPFDLLLSLILRDEVEVWEVPLGHIVEAYLSELDRMAALDLEVATEFLVIAATLIELKARRLLPGPLVEDPDDLELLSERDLLVARLLECRTFREAGAALARLMAAAERSHPRRVGPTEEYRDLRPSLGSVTSARDLAAALAAMAAPKPSPKVDLYHVAPIRASVAEVAEKVASDLGGRRLSFREITAGNTERIEVVLHFLAVLELFKEGRVELFQTSTFGELMVEATPAVSESAGLEAGAHLEGSQVMEAQW